MIIWEDEFNDNPALDAWFGSDPGIRKRKILGNEQEAEAEPEQMLTVSDI